MTDKPQSFGAIADNLLPKQETAPLQVEKYVMVHKGPELTPQMERLITAALFELVKNGARAVNEVNLGEIPVLVSDTVRFIETLYLGTNKMMLEDIERGLQLEKDHKLIGGGK